MTTAPNRRWFRFSLRTLFVVVTAFGLAIGCLVRTLTLQRAATWHDEQVKDMWHQYYSRGNPYQARSEHEQSARAAAYRRLENWHKEMAHTCRRAIWLPWATIGDGPPEPPDPEPELPRAPPLPF